MKQHFKNILVPFLASRPVSAIATRIFGYGIPIFMLHRTATDESSSLAHTPELIRKCLKLLKDNGHNFVSVADVLAAVRGEKTLLPKSIAFTIDDGYLHQANIAAPVFLEFDCPVTIFLITGFLDGELWPWFSKVKYLVENSECSGFELEFANKSHNFNLNGNDSRKHAARSIVEMMKSLESELIPETIDQISHLTGVNLPEKPPEEFSPMTWDIARELEKKGISFGPHTVSHPILARTSDHRSEHEIIESWKRINEELSNPVPIFCYPNGRTSDYGPREIDFIRKAGLNGALSTVQKQVDLKSHDNLYEFNLPRLNFPHSVEDLIQYSTWIEHAKQRL